MINTTYWFSEKIICRPSDIHGHGLFLTSSVSQGDRLIIAGGYLIKKAELTLYQKVTHSILPVPKSDNLLLTPTEHPYGASTLNHSCQPNLDFDYPIWKARQDIGAGTELTTDYTRLGFDKERDILLKSCNCKTKKCRGVIRSRP